MYIRTLLKDHLRFMTILIYAAFWAFFQEEDVVLLQSWVKHQ